MPTIKDIPRVLKEAHWQKSAQSTLIRIAIKVLFHGYLGSFFPVLLLAGLRLKVRAVQCQG